MAAPARTVILLPSATRTTTGTGSSIINIEGYTAARIRCTCTTMTGTSPTLNMRIQQGIATDQGSTTAGDQATGATSWDDFLSFTQFTTSDTTRYIRIVGGSNDDAAGSANALAANTRRNGPLGSIWRVAWVVGGTNPSIAGISVVAELIP